MKKLLSLAVPLLAATMGVAIGQAPTKEEIVKASEPISTVAYCYAYYVESGNLLKASGQQSKAIAAYNSAWTFRFLTKTMIIRAHTKLKIFSFDDSRGLLKFIDSDYKSIDRDGKKELETVCPTIFRDTFKNPDQNEKIILTGAKERADVFYKTKPGSFDSIVDEVEKDNWD